MKKQQFLKLECKYCGAPLHMIDKTHAKCSHCGNEYLIDEIEQEILDIKVDYSDTTEVKKAITISKVLLIVFLSLAGLGFCITVAVNIGVVTSKFFSADSDLPVINKGNLFVTFCEDIFGKEYGQITEEELASFKYIRYDHERGEDNDSYHVVEYSYTDYQDCESEEAFQDTIQRWTYRSEGMSWPANYKMFKGLTRINTVDSVWLSSLRFCDENDISYVETDDALSTVATVLNPEKIKVLHTGVMGTELEEIGRFTNLEELSMESTLAFGEESIDVSQLEVCQNLRVLKLNCSNAYSGLECLEKMPKLESLYLSSTTLAECTSLKNLSGLKELYICSGENPDLSVFSNLSNLEKLYFLDYEIIDAKSLCVLSNLEELDAEFASMEELKELVNLKKLKKLIANVEVDCGPMEEIVPCDLSMLSEMPSLCELSLGLDNSIFSDDFMFIGIEKLMNNPRMRWLHIYNESIGEMCRLVIEQEALQENANMETIAFSGCCFVDADTGEQLDYGFLTNYKKLRELYLVECDLANIDFISEMQELEICALKNYMFEGNIIMDYSKLLDCRRLKKLYVNNYEEINVEFPKDVEVSTEHFFNGMPDE